jgi:hypothetical protein
MYSSIGQTSVACGCGCVCQRRLVVPADRRVTDRMSRWISIMRCGVPPAYKTWLPSGKPALFGKADKAGRQGRQAGTGLSPNTSIAIPRKCSATPLSQQQSNSLTQAGRSPDNHPHHMLFCSAEEALLPVSHEQYTRWAKEGK